MAKKDRDYDQIIKGCDTLIAALEALAQCGKVLDNSASSAESSLRDEVGRKDIQNVKDLAEAIAKGVKGAQSSVMELKSQKTTERAAFESLM